MAHGPHGCHGSVRARGRCRLVLRRGQAVAPRPTGRFQDDRAARGATRGAPVAAFDPWTDANRGGTEFLPTRKRAIDEADEAELAARGAAASLSGRLRICAPVT